MRALAERAMACRGWEWMDGILDSWGYRGGSAIPRRSDAVVVLDDPATKGCMLELVRCAWRNHGAIVRQMTHHEYEALAVWWDGERRYCLQPDNDMQIAAGLAPWEDCDFWAWGHSEAECLVVALEKAPPHPEGRP